MAGLPGVLNTTLDVYAGDPRSFIIIMRDGSSQPVNLTGRTYACQWRKTASSTDAITLEIETTDLVNGTVTLIVSSDASNAIVGDNETVTGVFDIQGTDDDALTFLRGKLRVRKDVTRG